MWNGGVKFDEGVLLFDTGSLRQSSSEIEKPFNLLIAQRKSLFHALVLEDWKPDTELIIAKNTQWDNDEVLKKSR
ncbi:MAG: hypothetical protein LBJ36_10830 [Synergistaceae bacterium]|jgi:hypothetical protein|nr:hypothetical protein [Synergistaceae bacterium]